MLNNFTYSSTFFQKLLILIPNLNTSKVEMFLLFFSKRNLILNTIGNVYIINGKILHQLFFCKRIETVFSYVF